MVRMRVQSAAVFAIAMIPVMAAAQQFLPARPAAHEHGQQGGGEGQDGVGRIVDGGVERGASSRHDGGGEHGRRDGEAVARVAAGGVQREHEGEQRQDGMAAEGVAEREPRRRRPPPRPP